MGNFTRYIISLIAIHFLLAWLYVGYFEPSHLLILLPAFLLGVLFRGVMYRNITFEGSDPKEVYPYL